MITIIRKELADYFTSIRFLILLSLVCIASAIALYSAYSGIRGAGTAGFVFLRLFTTEPAGMPFAFLFNFVNFIALFFIPIIGISLGFDAINSERSSGTLSRVLSQPVFRDNVINGKFLAGIFTLFLMMLATILIVSGWGLRMIGVSPTAEEIVRLFVYLISIIIYGAFWISLAILLSVLFRSLATSLLTSVALWIFFSFGILIIALAVAKTPEMAQTILWFSPNSLFGQVTTVLLHPTVRTLGSISTTQAAYMLPNPLSFGQSLLLVWPILTSLVSLSAICFAASYVLFMRQEVRST